MLEKINTVTEKFVKTEKESFYPNNREKFLEEKIKGVTGSTWDATHMTSFLNTSFYSNKRSSIYAENPERKSYSIRRKNSGDYFFKNLRYDQNKSQIGYSKVNPLIANVETSKEKQQALINFFLSHSQKLNEPKREKSPVLRCEKDAKFNYEANKVKFKATDPLTSRYNVEEPEKSGYKIERMKRQLFARHNQGIIGIDNPHNTSTLFYEHSEEKKQRIRESPMSKTSFELDRDWKRKGRVTPIAEEFRFRQSECSRKFRNENSHGYNIINNRVAEE